MQSLRLAATMSFTPGNGFKRLGFLTLLALLVTVASAPAGLVHQWTFDDGTANDSVGTNHGTLYNGATVFGGELRLDGVNDYFRTSQLAQTLSNRTLMVWVTLSNLTQQAGSALTLEDPTGADVFDGIVYGEQVTNRWINGSDNGWRWNSEAGTAASPEETTLSQVWIAIVYGDPTSAADNIKIYRNGVLSADYTPGSPLITYHAGLAGVVIGVRHSDLVGGSGTPEGFDEFLAGSINEARIYDTALTVSQIADISNGQVVLNNPGFEAPALAVGGYTYNLPGWTDIASGSPTNARFVEHISGFAAEGNQHLGMEPGWSVWQDPGATYQANTIYRLRVAVGNRPGWTVAGNLSTFTLTDPTGSVTRSSTFDASTIPASTFVETQVVLDTTTTPTLVGKPIRIQLTAGGNSRSHFDRVRLDTQVQRVSLDDASTWLGFMNVLDLPSDGGAYRFGQPWATADLSAVFDTPWLMTLTPNTSFDRDSPNDPYWWKAPGDNPNKNLGAVMYVEDDSLAGSTVYFSGFTVSNSLVAPYTCIAFIRDFVPDYSSFTEVTTPLVAGSVFNLIMSTTPGNHIQYGFHTTGPNARLATAPSLGRVQVSSIGAYFPVVTNTNDSGPGSLRQTIADAVSGATITFAPALSGQTITLTNGQLLIEKSLAINASTLPAGIAVSGNGQSRIFNIASGRNVVLTSLVLADGYPGPGGLGGAIANSGTLAVNNCTLAGNTVDSGVAGGGIGNYGTLTLSGCTFVDNSAGFGGAMDNRSLCVAQNCTFYGNTASENGGAIDNVFGANLTILNCTFLGNTASSAGGAIDNYLSQVNLTNTILAANLNHDVYNWSGSTITSGGSNIVQAILNNGTLVGANSILSANPQLAAFGNYGGPTQTLPPMPGSPAINAGLAIGSLPTDQRGFARVVGSSVDIGAVEATLGEAYPIVTTTADSGAGSLRQVMTETLPGSTVTFTNSLSGQTILLTSGQLLIDKNLTIDASPLAGGVAINGNNASRIFEMKAGTTNVLLNLTLTGGNGNGATFSGRGGAVFNGGKLALTNCVLTGNEVPSGGVGGGLYTTGAGSAVTVVGCVFSTNRTIGGSNGGGGIYADNSTLYGADSMFRGNISSNTAGAVHVISGAVGTLTRCTFEGNLAPGGGAVRNTSATLTLSDCVFTANVATSDGGAIWDQGTTVASRCTFTGNAATNYGGGIFNLGNTTLNECSLGANAGAVGGALASYGTVTISGCTVASNTATVAGGGMANAGSVTINQSTVTGNFAPANSGGIYSQNALAINQCTVVSNTTAGPGGGILINGGTASLTNTIVAGNSANSGTNIFGSFTGANNLTSGNPLLAPLGNYGGPTQTMPPLPGSPAIDMGNDAAASSFTYDQRGPGFPRISGDHVDIGAVERQLITSSTPVAIIAPESLGNGTFQFSFANDSGASFRVLATTNVTMPASNWTFLGFAAEMPPGSGQFQFTDPGATNHPQRYYRVKSP